MTSTQRDQQRQPCNHREVLGNCSSWARKGSMCQAEPWWMHRAAVRWKQRGQRHISLGCGDRSGFGRGLTRWRWREADRDVEACSSGHLYLGNRKLGAIHTPEQVSDSTGATASKLIQQQCVRLETGGWPEEGAGKREEVGRMRGLPEI